VGAKKRKLIEDHTALARREKPKLRLALVNPEPKNRMKERSSAIFLHVREATFGQSTRSGR
jgi:hypothetical protein